MSQSVVDRMKNLLSTGVDADVYFLVGGGDAKELLQAHKLILKLASEVFEAMFRFDAKNEKPKFASPNSPVEMPDVEAAAFKIMLSFIYADDLSELNGDNAMAVLYAAKKYNIPGLVDPCLQIHISELRNVFVAYAYACLFDLKNFANCCLAYIDQNVDSLLKSEEFLQIDQKTFCKCSTTLRIVSQKNDVADLRREFNDYFFDNKKTSLGSYYFISFPELVDPNNGFYDKSEDKMTLAIDVTVKEAKRSTNT
ncbi:hypothetical protein niasHS_004447 [Heterodera schachtii]|uniref:BTB domain-containing protein n=1 Tax=Heterodera schachtii TaxID=97005 RepID=A0ABD2JR39_HETSC